MACPGRTLAAVIVVGEVGIEWRHVERLDHRGRIALQAVHRQSAAGLQQAGNGRIRCHAQSFAGRPKRATTNRAIDIAGRDRSRSRWRCRHCRYENSAGNRWHIPSAPETRNLAGWIVGVDRPEAQHAVLARQGQRIVVIGAGRRAAFGNQHVAGIVKKNFGDFGTGLCASAAPTAPRAHRSQSNHRAKSRPTRCAGRRRPRNKVGPD